MKTNQTPLLPSAVALAFTSLSPMFCLAEKEPLNAFDKALNPPQEQAQAVDEFWQRPSYLGVQMRSLLFNDRQDLLIGNDESGVIIDEVYPNSPAEKAGILPGDILLSLDGNSIEDAQGLIDLVQANDPQDIVELKLLRDNERLALDVNLEEMPFAFEQAMEEQRARAFAPQFVPLPQAQGDNGEPIPLIIQEGQLIFPENFPKDLANLFAVEPEKQLEELEEMRAQMQQNRQELLQRFQEELQQLEQLDQFQQLQPFDQGNFRQNWMKRENGNTTIELSDGKGRVRITEKQGQQPLVELFDEQGELFLSENLESLEGDLDAIPEEHRQRVRSAMQLNSNNLNLEFNFGGDLFNLPEQPEAEKEQNQGAQVAPPGFH